ncbi:MAG: hypothetical protein HYX92_03735 [Chloroflexi bacterium]|nr:hypothetical protein [Chloroflexota bacterium]
MKRMLGIGSAVALIVGLGLWTVTSLAMAQPTLPPGAYPTDGGTVAQAAAPTRDSSFQIMNLSSSATASVEIRYFNADGTLAASETAQIPPSSSLLRDTRGGPNPTPPQLPKGFNGSVEVISDQPVVGNSNIFQSNNATDGYNGFTQMEVSKNVLLPLIYGYGSADLWHTAFTVQNPNDVVANITMTYADGVTGAVVDTVTDMIPAHGSRTYNQSTRSFFFGSVSITSDQAVAAVVNQSNAEVLITYPGFNKNTEPGTTVHLPLLFKSQYWNTAIQVQNVDPSKPATVTIEVTDQKTGQKFSTAQVVTTSKSFDFRGASDATTGGLNVPTGFRGSGVITSTQPVVAVVNEMLNFPGQPLDKIFKAMNYKGVAQNTSTKSLLPLLYRQNPWGCVVQVKNMSPTGASANVTILAKDQYTGKEYTARATIATAMTFDVRSDDPALNGGLALPMGFYGSATVTSDQPIAVVVNQEDTMDNSVDRAIGNNGVQQ